MCFHFEQYNKANICLSLKVVFYPVQADPRWWYVVQTAPRSRHIFQEGGVEEEMPHGAILMEPINEISMEETSSSTNDTSHEGDQDSLHDDLSDNDCLIFQEMAINSDEEDTINTSLGINLEVVLEISHEDMFLDEISISDM